MGQKEYYEEILARLDKLKFPGSSEKKELSWSAVSDA